MAGLAAHKRLKKEYAGLAKAPPPYIIARPDENDLLECHFIMRGPEGEVYEGGEYHGVLTFPTQYPFAPPAIKMITPSGRFVAERKICMSMSDFHPGSWNPAWSVETILNGLLSFMLSDEQTTGGMKATDAERRRLAQISHAVNCKHLKFRCIFPEYSEPSMMDLPNMGEKERGLTTKSPTMTNPPKPSSVSTGPALLPGGSPIALAPAGRVDRIRVLWWGLGAVIASALVSRLMGR